VITEREAALAVLDKHLRMDPAWRFYRTFGGKNHRRVIESEALYLHVGKPNQVGGTLAMCADAALYLKGVHPVRPRPKEPMQLLFIVPKKAQIRIFENRFFRACGIVSAVPAFAKLLAKEPDLAEIGKRPFLCPESECHLEKTGSSQGRVASKATVPGPYGNDELFFYISGDEKAWESLMGNNFHGIYRDEAVAKGDNLMPELRTRVGIHHDRHATDRPGCGYIRWSCLVSKYSEELREFRNLCEAKVEGHDIVKLEYTDNPAISKETREKQAKGLSKKEADKRIWGTADAFDEDLILRVNRALVVTPERYVVQPEDNLWMVYDPGWKDPCGLALFAVPKDSQHAVMIQYRSWAGGTTHEHAQCIADMLKGRLAVTVVCDYQLKAPSTITGISGFTVFCESLTHAGVRLNTAPCFSPKRYESDIPMLQTYLSQQEGRKLLFDLGGDGVEEALCQLEAYRYKDKHDHKLLEANVYQKGVEAVDVCRYFCSRFFSWVDIGPHTALSEYVSRVTPEPTVEDIVDRAAEEYERNYNDFMEFVSPGGQGLQFERFSV
jgi:hypothetical protein